MFTLESGCLATGTDQTMLMIPVTVKAKAKTHKSDACFILAPQVAFIGEDIERIPEDLIQRHGQTAKRLDLSFNRLRYWLSILSM